MTRPKPFLTEIGIRLRLESFGYLCFLGEREPKTPMGFLPCPPVTVQFVLNLLIFWFYFSVYRWSAKTYLSGGGDLQSEIRNTPPVTNFVVTVTFVK